MLPGGMSTDPPKWQKSCCCLPRCVMPVALERPVMAKAIVTHKLPNNPGELRNRPKVAQSNARNLQHDVFGAALPVGQV